MRCSLYVLASEKLNIWPSHILRQRAITGDDEGIEATVILIADMDERMLDLTEVREYLRVTNCWPQVPGGVAGDRLTSSRSGPRVRPTVMTWLRPGALSISHLLTPNTSSHYFTFH